MALPYPFWRCMSCGVDIAEARLPITPHVMIPICPRCLHWRSIDLVLGDELTVLGDEDMIIFDDGMDD